MAGLPKPLSGRAVYVYQLEISYPEGSDAPGWHPARWESFLRKLPARSRRKARRTGFRWPQERRFLSSSGAYGRAALLRWAGCEVEVIRSEPVWFPPPLWEETDGARDPGGLELSALLPWFDPALLNEGTMIIMMDGKAGGPGLPYAGGFPDER